MPNTNIAHGTRAWVHFRKGERALSVVCWFGRESEKSKIKETTHTLTHLDIISKNNPRKAKETSRTTRDKQVSTLTTRTPPPKKKNGMPHVVSSQHPHAEAARLRSRQSLRFRYWLPEALWNLDWRGARAPSYDPKNGCGSLNPGNPW